MLDCNGPGLIKATCIVKSANERGWKRGINDACARLSIWNIPIVSPRQIISNTSWSSNLSLSSSGDGFIRAHASEIADSMRRPSTSNLIQFMSSKESLSH